MTTEAEAAILDKYRADVASRQAERERQRLQERARKEQRKRERTEIRDERRRVEAALGKKIDRFDAEDMEDESLPSSTSSMPEDLEGSSTEAQPVTRQGPGTVDDAAVQQAVEEVSHIF